MKKTLLIAYLSVVTFTAFCQKKNISTNPGKTNDRLGNEESGYGPIPYRTLKQTIGQDYLVLDLGIAQQLGYPYLQKGTSFDETYNSPQKIKENIPGKLLKLTAVDDNFANFKDEKGIDYVEKITFGHLFNLILASDLYDAKRLLLNKTLWVKLDELRYLNPPDEDHKTISGLKFEPVKVIDIAPSTADIALVLLTSKGEKAIADLTISGTNALPGTLLKFSFNKYFYLYDIKTKYNFTPAVWAKIKAGVVSIGMTTDQVELAIGPPNKINNTETANTLHSQWVYDSSYYYFTNNKLTAVQH